MSKRTGNRTGKAAKKRRTRHRARVSKRWHELNEVCRTCWHDYPRERTHYHLSDCKGGWYSWSIDWLEGRKPRPLFDECVTYSNRPMETGT